MIQEIEEIIGLDCSNILKVSAKMGIGIEVRRAWHGTPPTHALGLERCTFRQRARQSQIHNEWIGRVLPAQDTLEAIVKRVPPPRSTINQALRALIFDSYYDPYRGVVCQFRVMDGSVRPSLFPPPPPPPLLPRALRHVNTCECAAPSLCRCRAATRWS